MMEQQDRLMRDRRHPDSGYILVTAIAVTSFLAIFGAAALMESFGELNVSLHEGYLARSFQLAEAAVDHELEDLAAGNELPIADSLASGTYWTELAPLDPGYYLITAHGLSTPNQSNLEVVTFAPNLKKYPYAVFSDTTISIGRDNSVDSFDSRNGAYGGANVSDDGDLGTNATGAGSVIVGKDADVYGDIAIGPGGNTGTDIGIGPGAVVTGSLTTLAQPQVITAAQSAASSYPSSLVLGAGASQTLAGGVYAYSAVTMGSFSTLTITGDVVINIDQALTVGQGSQIVTSCADCTVIIYVEGGSDPAVSAVHIMQDSYLSAGGDPTRFRIFVTGDGGARAGKVDIDQNNGVYAVIDAPLSDVHFDQGGSIYGAIVGYQVSLDRYATIHYDEALNASANRRVARVEVLSWRQL